MCSSDPSLVDSATLRRSLANDLKEAQYAAAKEDFLAALRWTEEARITARELLRRAHLRAVV